MTTPFTGEQSGPKKNQTMVWIIPVLIAGIVIITAFIVCVIIALNNRRRYKRAQTENPYLTPEEFSKRRKLSAAGQFEEEERKRRSMIRKSLASRSWDSVESNASRRTSQTSHLSQGELPNFVVIEDPEEEEEPVRLKEDWKAWEARMQRERSMSGERHPAVDAVPVTDLPVIPTASRPRSPIRSPPRSPPPGSLVPPPRHPARRSLLVTET